MFVTLRGAGEVRWRHVVAAASITPLSSICRMRSRVTPKSWPICSSVWPSGLPMPKRMRTTLASRSVSTDKAECTDAAESLASSDCAGDDACRSSRSSCRSRRRRSRRACRARAAPTAPRRRDGRARARGRRDARSRRRPARGRACAKARWWRARRGPCSPRMLAGTRMVRGSSATARDTATRIHHVA